MVEGLSLPRLAPVLLGLLLLLPWLPAAAQSTPPESAPQEPEPPPLATSQAEPSPPAGAADEERCRKEVEELHAFFQAWFNGTVDSSDESFARVSGVLGEHFAIIGPAGHLTERDAVLEGLRRTYKPEGAEPVEIRIENFHLRQRQGDVVVVTYEQWQKHGNQGHGRLCTAVLHERADTPNGFEWLHVHETWLPR